MKLMINISEELYAKVPTLINKGNIWIGDVLEAVKDGTPLEAQPILDTRQRERQLEMEYQHGYDKGWKEGRKALKQESCEDCRNCKKWNECPCGKEGHENGTSVGYSIGECKNYEPYEDCISREAVLLLQTEYAEKMGATTFWKLRDDIRALPPVTPERPKGKWIGSNGVNYTYPNSFTICSVCKCHSDNFYKYCPNCGAEMEGGEDDT